MTSDYNAARKGIDNVAQAATWTLTEGLNDVSPRFVFGEAILERRAVVTALSYGLAYTGVLAVVSALKHN
jgi:hypothetical protein